MCVSVYNTCMDVYVAFYTKETFLLRHIYAHVSLDPVLAGVALECVTLGSFKDFY